jgi:hypothetical protein
MSEQHHPLNMSGSGGGGYNQSFFGSGGGSPNPNQAVNHSTSGSIDGSNLTGTNLMDYSHTNLRDTQLQHSNNPSMPSNFTFLNEINSIQTFPQQSTHQSHDIPALITPSQQQLDLLEVN